MSDTNDIFNLKSQDIREMKNKLHQLKPIVVVSNNGLTEDVFQEIDIALENNELIKIRTIAETSEELAKIASEICEKAKATLIQTIGSIIAIYRKSMQSDE